MKIKSLLKLPSLIKKKIDDFFIIPLDQNSIDQEAYIRHIENGDWKDRVVLGISDKRRDFLAVDPVVAPGQCAIGGMGSGKSVAMKFTVSTHLMCNSENTMYILIDAEKGMTDYKNLFKYKENVVTALNAPEKFIPVMDMIAEEMELRKFEFSRVGAENIYAYEDIMRKQDPSFPGLARIVLCFEEFHALTNSKQINFQMNIDRPNTAAYQFRNFMRVGRSVGCNTIIATQRATSEDIPGSLKPGLTLFMAFRVNNPGDAAIANLPAAADIRANQRGRCAYEEGFMQFPYLKDKLAVKLLEEKVKPLKAKLLGKQVQDYHLATSGEGTEGFVWVKPLVQLIDARGQFEPRNIAKRILKECDFTFENQDNTALIAHLIAERDGERYAVVVVADRGDASPKAISNLKNSLDQLKCKKVLGISFDSSVPSALQSLCNETGGIAVERDDLEQFAKLIDNRKEFSKENFQSRFDNFSLSRAYQSKKTGAKDDSDIEDEIDSDFDNDDFMEKAFRMRQGNPDLRPKKFRG